MGTVKIQVKVPSTDGTITATGVSRALSVCGRPCNVKDGAQNRVAFVKCKAIYAETMASRFLR